MKRNGEDMLRKTEEGAVSTGAEAGTATGGKAYDWCVCVYILPLVLKSLSVHQVSFERAQASP